MASSIPIKYKWFSNRSIWPMDGTLTHTTSPGQNGTKNNDYKESLPFI